MADVSAKKIDPHWAWQPYRPSAAAPWNLQRVGHLYRRAAFGATYAELQAGLAAGPETLLARMLKGGPDAAESEDLAGRANSVDGQHLAAWWLMRILYSPHPLREKLTLFWHNHFATSNGKVKSPHFMLAQNELLRRHALGSFATLLQGMSEDRAMMVWLDTRDSKKGNPNENYARELMELFSLGIGHYTEKDIREAARAFTGWEVHIDQAVFNPKEHDDGEKTVLGRKGRWKGADVVRICLEQRACAPFLAGKLFRFLISETIEPAPELLEPLATRFRDSGYDIGGLVKTMLASNLFFSDLAYRTRVKAPVDFALGIVRGLEGRVGTSALAAALEGLGQNLFHPPSVKGWDGGRTWLNGQTLLFRQNLALALTSTEDPRFHNRLDPAETARKYGKRADEEVVDLFLRLFLQGDVPAGTRARLLDYQRRSHQPTYPVYWSTRDVAGHRVRALCHLVLTLPEFQLD